MKIRHKSNAAILLIVIVSGVMGLYAIWGMTTLDALTTRMYDQPLMATSFARSAHTNFIKLDRSLTLALTADDPEVSAAQVAQGQEFEDLIREDLDIVAERVLTEDARELVSTIENLLNRSQTLQRWLHTDGGESILGLTRMLQEKQAEFTIIEDNFDLLVEQVAVEGFLFRQDASATQETIARFQIIALGVVMLISLVTAVFLGRSAFRPIEVLARIIHGGP